MTDERRVIFCHIPKCGGTSIRKLLPVQPRGHVPLSKIIAMGIYRPGDWFFTVIREPMKLAISQVNYVTHMLIKGWDTPRDSWRHQLGDRANGTPDDIARAVLHTPGVVHENPLCKYLGDGTPTGALDLVRASGIKVIDLPHLSAWLSTNWPECSWRKLNISPDYLGQPGEADYRRLDEISSKDRILYKSLKEMNDD